MGEAKEHGLTTGKGQVLVIGAGVLGLTSALALARSGHRITLLARDLPGTLSVSYASPWAGAHFRPVPVTTTAERRDHELTRETYDVFRRLAEEKPECGIAWVEGREYFDSPGKDYTDMDPEKGFAAWPGCRVLRREEMDGPKGISWGVRYDAWVINSPVYLGWLFDRLREFDHSVVTGEVASVQEAVAVAREKLGIGHVRFDAVVNASGMGMGDADAYISRGQFLLVEGQASSTISHHWRDGTSTVIVPRPLGGGTLIGGSKEVDNWSPYPNSSTTATILERVTKLSPELVANGPLEVIRENVGRRPMRRGGMRLELKVAELIETAADGLGTVTRPLRVVHCYGAGGSGFKVSWGVAQRVLELVEGVEEQEADK